MGFENCCEQDYIRVEGRCARTGSKRCISISRKQNARSVDIGFPLLIYTHSNNLGQYEFVKKGDPPVVGITKLDGITMEELKRPRRKIPLDSIPVGTTTESIPPTVSTSTSPDA